MSGSDSALARCACAALLVICSCAHVTSVPGTDPASPLVSRPIIVAHRGASGYLPEHTLAAYEKAIEMGADHIELDLVATRDGALIVRHENEMSETTDVATRYPGRKATKTVDGREHTGFFSEDFTLAEIRTLRAKERLPGRSQEHNGRHGVPTLEDVIRLTQRKEAELGRPIGLYIETKHPSYFQKLNLALEPPLVAALNSAGLNRPGAPVFIQSFETTNLKALSRQLRVPLIQLLEDASERPFDLVLSADGRSYGDLVSPEGLREIATYAQGIGPWKQLVLAPGGSPSALVENAHSAGLLVHPYTFRSDPGVLPEVYAGKPEREYEAFFALGVDGVFTDFPDHAVSVRNRLFPAAAKAVSPDGSEVTAVELLVR